MTFRPLSTAVALALALPFPIATASAAGQATDLDMRLAQMSASTTDLATANTQLQAQVLGLVNELTALKAAQAEAAKLNADVKELGTEVAALKKQGNPAQLIRSLEQDLLVLRSELDNRPAASAGPNTAEFDAFRAQMTRNINTLQSQVMNLQQQINQR